MGFDFHKFLDILQLVGPIVLPIVGVPPVLIPLVVHGIQIAETSASTGPEKKAMALDAVATGIAGINAVKPDTISPDITKVVSDGIDVAVAAVNAVAKHPALNQ